VGAADDPENYMGPVISAGARKTILEYIETGKQEGRLVPGTPVPRRRLFRAAHRHRRRRRQGAHFPGGDFRPGAGGDQGRDFEHALELANDSQYGLTGAVFSNDPEHLREAGERSTSAICI
jgi:1-pyrroline-5-carboxylate dehydrogenase